MTIGLVDIDCHAKKKKWGAKLYPNIALCKIARYHRQRGDSVEWAIAFKHYDRLYKSKIFNFSEDDLTCYDADEVICGGTGYDIHSQLPDEIDRLQPDYSIYPNVPGDTAYGFLTRGCPNKCPWCVVPRKEGAIRPYMDVDEIAIEGRRKLVLMDNNILAAGDYAVRQLEKIIERGYRVDFNQALDARLVSPGFAKLLARVKWLDNNRIRFGCDTHAQIAECEKVIEEYPKPVAQVRCHNCGSLLEYGNADLHYKMSNEMVCANIVALKGYYIWCPVCGCEVAVSQIPRPKKGGEQ